MVQILPAAKTFGSQLGLGLGSGIGKGLSSGVEHKMEEKKKASDFARQMELSQQKEKNKKEAKFQEKLAPLEGAQNRLNRMQEILETGHLGPKISQGFLGLGLSDPETRQHRAEFEQLGKSLISMASTIPIRNQIEFETLSKDLYDPTRTEAQIRGTLDAMRRIIQDSISEYESERIEGTSESAK